MKHGIERDEESAKRQKREVYKDILKERFERLRKVRLSQKILDKIEMEQEESEEEEGGEEEDEDEDEDEDGDEEEDEEEDEVDSEDEMEDLMQQLGVDSKVVDVEVDLDVGDNERRRLLVESMDGNQLSRYESFRRTTLNAGGVKKLLNAVCGGGSGGNVGVEGEFAKLVGAVGKVFVGEVVQLAVEEQQREGKEAGKEAMGGQLTPHHIAVAWQKLYNDQNGNRAVMREWRAANRRGLF